MSDEDEGTCGEAWDHDLVTRYDGPDGRQYECRTCGAELWEEPEGGTMGDLTEQDLVTDALQSAWNDFVGDTGCIPDAFSIQNGRANTTVTADFAVGNFATFVAGFLRAALPEGVVLTSEGLARVTEVEVYWNYGMQENEVYAPDGSITTLTSLTSPLVVLTRIEEQ